MLHYCCNNTMKLPSKFALRVLCIILSCLSAIVIAQSDPLCSACPYRTCTYDKPLTCNCSGAMSGFKTVPGFTDQEYSNVSLGFAIDGTGSMATVIDSVKSTIKTVVLATSHIFDKFVLGTFNDPYNLTIIESLDTVAITKFVDQIRALEGDDCPEMALTGIKDVANRVTVGSAIFVITDASAKDLHLESEVKALLLLKDIRLNVIAINILCGTKTGGEFYRLANATGGTVYSESTHYDVYYVMSYIAKYAMYGVRYIRGIPKNLKDVKTLVDGNCSCTIGSASNLTCLTPAAAFQSTDGGHQLSGSIGSSLVSVLMVLFGTYVAHCQVL